MQKKEDIEARIKFFEKQQQQTKDTDFKITCGMIIGVLKWVLLEENK